MRGKSTAAPSSMQRSQSCVSRKNAPHGSGLFPGFIYIYAEDEWKAYTRRVEEFGMPPHGGIKKLKSVQSLKGRPNVFYAGSTKNPATRYSSAQPGTMYVTRSKNMVKDEQLLLDYFDLEKHKTRTWRSQGLQNDHEKAGNAGRGWVYVLVMPDEDGSTVRRKKPKASPCSDSVGAEEDWQEEREDREHRMATAESLRQLDPARLAALVIELYKSSDEAQNFVDDILSRTYNERQPQLYSTPGGERTPARG